MYTIIRYAFIALFIFTTAQAHTVYIVIHGTWACATAWANPGGNFFDALEKRAHPDLVVPYTWNGANNHNERWNAAHGLAKLIHSYPQATSIRLVAHSHGANVAMLASQLLAADPNNTHTIAALYALGVPVNTTEYAPDMSIVHHVYNIFSFEDMIQPVFNLFGRVYPKHPRIANLRLFIDNREPDHTGLHSPFCATVLPDIPQLLCLQNYNNANATDISQPALLYVETPENEKQHITLRYAVDSDRDYLLERDIRINNMLISSFSRTLHEQKRAY